MTAKLVLHLFNSNPAALATVPSLADRLRQNPGAEQQPFEVYVFGPAEAALSSADQAAFNAQIDGLGDVPKSVERVS